MPPCLRLSLNLADRGQEMPKEAWRQKTPAMIELYYLALFADSWTISTTINGLNHNSS